MDGFAVTPIEVKSPGFSEVMVYSQYGLPAEQILSLVLGLLRLGPVLSYTPSLVVYD